MKRICLISLINLIAVFLLIQVAYPIPMNYTFQGTLTGFAGDAGIIAANGLERGGQLSYTVLIDFDLPGSTTLNDGTVITYPFATDGVNGNYLGHPDWTFYADYLGGSALQVTTTGIAEDNRLVAWNKPDEEGRLYLNYNNTLFNIIYWGSDSPLTWEVGDLFRLQNGATEIDGRSVYFETWLNLTEISPSPVPEPGTMILLGLGLAGFAILRPRRDITADTSQRHLPDQG